MKPAPASSGCGRRRACSIAWRWPSRSSSRRAVTRRRSRCGGSAGSKGRAKGPGRSIGNVLDPSSKISYDDSSSLNDGAGPCACHLPTASRRNSLCSSCCSSEASEHTSGWPGGCGAGRLKRPQIDPDPTLFVMAASSVAIWDLLALGNGAMIIFGAQTVEDVVHFSETTMPLLSTLVAGSVAYYFGAQSGTPTAATEQGSPVP